MDWFFDGLIGSNDKTDYAVTKLQKGDSYKIGVKNKGQLNTPFPISAIKDSQIVHTQWYDGFSGERQLDFPKGDYDKLVIDSDKLTLDVYRKNNTIRTTGLFPKKRPLELKFLAGIESSNRSRLFWTPIAGYNAYDNIMLGLGLYNITVPAKPFEFSFAPMYSFTNKELVGFGNIKYNFFPESDAFKKNHTGPGCQKI